MGDTVWGDVLTEVSRNAKKVPRVFTLILPRDTPREVYRYLHRQARIALRMAEERVVNQLLGGEPR